CHPTNKIRTDHQPENRQCADSDCSASAARPRRRGDRVRRREFISGPIGLALSGKAEWSSITRKFVSLGTQIVIRLLLCFVNLAAFAATVCAQAPVASPNENIDWPSPDGKFAFLTSYGEDLHVIDLIDKKAGKKLQRIGEEDSSQAYWHVLWAPDS